MFADQFGNSQSTGAIRAITGHVEFENHGVVHEPIDRGDRGHLIAKDPIPLAKHQVTRHHHRAAFIPFGQERKKHFGFVGPLLHVPQVIQQDHCEEIQLSKGARQPSGLSRVKIIAMAADLDVARQLIDVGRRFEARGWVLGTSGNFSAVLTAEPLRLAMTESGTAKGQLTIDQILEIDGEGRVCGIHPGRPSAETPLHLEIVRSRDSRAVLHTHSIWSTILSDRHAARHGLAIEGYEMLKGLEGVDTHKHREWIPILENDQDMTCLAGAVRDVLVEHPAAHALLLRRHGMYTWGRTLSEAVRHVEIVEFLLEALARSEPTASGVR